MFPELCSVSRIIHTAWALLRFRLMMTDDMFEECSNCQKTALNEPKGYGIGLAQTQSIQNK